MIAELHGSHSCAINVRPDFADAGTRLTWTDNYSLEIIDAYRSGGFKKDLFAETAKAGPGSVFSTTQLPMTEAQFVRTDFYNEYCRDLGIFHAIGSVFPLGISGGIGLISIHRERHHSPFAKRYEQQFGLFLPHLIQALQLRTQLMRLHIERHASLAALEAMRLGTIVVDESGYIVFANPTAESLIRGRNDVAVRYGRLHLKDSTQNAALMNAIKSACRIGAGKKASTDALFGVPPVGPRTLAIRVCPLPEQLFPGEMAEPAVFIFLSDAQTRPSSLHERLIDFYGLTPAEARLAEVLATGGNLVEFCAQTQLSINTAKTHLKHIFAKTGHRRQSQFVRDMLGNPLLHMDFPTAADALDESDRRRR
jgi:DNA-binding CsgD family transcriptional regulator